VVRPDHPLAGRAAVRLSEIAEYPVALPAEGLTLRALFDEGARRIRLALEPVVETNSIDLLKRMAMLSEVATVLTKADVEIDRQRGVLAFVPIRGGEIGAQSLVIVHRTSAPLDPISTRFAEKLAELARQIGDEGMSGRVGQQRAESVIAGD
jgi:DNA-binding transcriptional LysR family regulator